MLGKLSLLPSLMAASLCLPAVASADGGRVSNELSVKNYGVADGLSQSNVNDLAVDSLGFLWIGTDDGLNRFDGADFIHVGFDPAHATEEGVERVTVGPAGFIWTSRRDGGVRCFCPQSDSYLPLVGDDGRGLDLSGGSVVCCGDSLVVVYGAACGCCAFRPDGGDAVRCVWSDTSSCRCAAVAPDGGLWLGGRSLVRLSPRGDAGRVAIDGDARVAVSLAVADGIVVVADGSSLLRRVVAADGGLLPSVDVGGCGVSSLEVVSGSVVAAGRVGGGVDFVDAGRGVLLSVPGGGADASLCRDNAGGVWLHDGRGMLRRVGGEGVSDGGVRFMDEGLARLLPDPGVRIVRDAADPWVYWVASFGGGLVRYDVGADVAESVVSRSAYVPAYVRCVGLDFSGNVWVGGDGAGLVKVSPRDYSSWTLRPGEPSRLSPLNDVVAVLETVDGNVWVGVKNDGLYVYDPSLSRLLFRSPMLRPLNITADGKGRVWVATEGGRLRVFDLAAFAELSHVAPAVEPCGASVRPRVVKTLADRQGRVWFVSSAGGVDLLEEPFVSGGRCGVRHFSFGNAAGAVADAMVDSQGFVWIATDRALICFDPARLVKSSDDYVTYGDDLLPGRVRVLAEDAKGRLCAGIVGGGLCRLSVDVGDDAPSQFTERDGLPSDEVVAMAVADDTSMWVATENGLALFNLRTEKFFPQKVADTDFGNIFNARACVRRANGNILWGSLDGLLELNPRCKGRRVGCRTPCFAEVWVDGDRVEFQDGRGAIDAPAAFASRVDLDQDFVEVALRVADVGGDADFVYVLEGRDDVWRPLPRCREVAWRGLGPGSYLLKVCSKSGGAATLSSIELRVGRSWLGAHPYFLFHVVALGLILAFVAFIVWHFRKKAVEARVTDRALEYRDALLTAVNGEVLVPLRKIENAVEAMLSVEGGVPGSVRPLVAAIKVNMDKLMGMVASILGHREAVGAVPLNLEVTNMAPFLGGIVKNFAHGRRQSVALDVVGGWRVQIDRDKVARALDLLLTCSGKCTPPGGEIVVRSFLNADSQCVIEVADRGPGVPADRREVIFGNMLGEARNDIEIALFAVRDFVVSHHGAVSYSPRSGGGTVISILLPTDYSLFPDVNSVPGFDGGDAVADDIAAPRLWGDGGAAASLRDPQVLVVCADEARRRFLVDRLRGGFAVAAVPDVRAARGKVEAMMPDLVVCHAAQSAGDIAGFVQFMKRSFNTSHVPVFVIARGGEFEADAADGLAPDMLFLEPLDFLVLLRHARAAVVRVLGLTPASLHAGHGAGDDGFMAKIEGVVEANIANVDFGIGDMAAQMDMRADALSRRLLQQTGCAPGEYVKLARLDRAREALAEGRATPSQVVRSVGVTDVGYFSKCFFRLYGAAPGLDMCRAL